jgi:hypothetical protein
MLAGAVAAALAFAVALRGVAHRAPQPRNG